MYIIEAPAKGTFRTIPHGMDVFARARALGEERILVIDEDGEDYLLTHVNNKDFRPEYFKKRWPDQTCYFEYPDYDETNVNALYLPFIRECGACHIALACEYSVAVAKVFLKYAECPIYYSDPRLMRFLEADQRLIFGDLPEELQEKALMIGMLESDKNRMPGQKILGPVAAFHNIFFLQGSGCFDIRKIKYAEVILDNQAGIGSIMSNLSRYTQAFAEFGIRLICRSGRIGRFSAAFLNEYFSFDLQAEDATDENTLLIPETAPFVATRFLLKNKPRIDISVISPTFRTQMQEYADAVLGKDKVLGVLIRGTDYILVNQNSPRQMAGADQVSKFVDHWMEEDMYDRIFLATEDLDVLNFMRKRYGKKLIVIAQERHSISELQGKMLLADLERKDTENYDGTVAENTVNYFYALYVLSCCNSFICSGYCNGYELVKAFNAGRFEKEYLFEIAVS